MSAARLIRGLLLGLALAAPAWAQAPTGPVEYESLPNCPDSAGQHLNYGASTGLFSCGSTGGSGGGGGGSASAGGTSGQIQINLNGAFAGITPGGDVSFNSGSGAFTVTKTNGVNFAASATTDTTNAGNISSGTLPGARLPASGVTAGTYGDATHVAEITVDATGRVTSASNVGVSGGGGGGSTSPGGTSGQIQINLAGAFAGITPGGDVSFNSGSGAFTVTKTNGVNFAASATTDTTNAGNISSGTLPGARLPASGVTAGTYGDATHVAEITVDATGRVTSASNVGVSGAGGSSGYTVTPVTTSPYVPSATSMQFLCVKNTSSATAINLPSGPASGLQYVIKDCLGNAQTYNITITPASGTIDGQSSLILNESHVAVTIIYDGSQWEVF